MEEQRKQTEQHKCRGLMRGDGDLGPNPGVAAFRVFSILFSQMLTLSWLRDDLKDDKKWADLRDKLRWSNDDFNALANGIEIGSAFIDDIDDNGLDQAIKDWFDFEFPKPPDDGGKPGKPWLILALNENSLTGKIEVVHTGKAEGMQLMWTLPYSSWPKAVVDHAELAQWARTCAGWIRKGDYKETGKPFPTPNVPYVPFGTY